MVMSPWRLSDHVGGTDRIQSQEEQTLGTCQGISKWQAKIVMDHRPLLVRERSAVGWKQERQLELGAYAGLVPGIFYKMLSISL